jgi:hypothetical protein
MEKWTQIGEWKVNLQLVPLPGGFWDWSFSVVDGPSGTNTGGPEISDSAAFEQARTAAAQAIDRKAGPDSAETQFGSPR